MIYFILNHQFLATWLGRMGGRILPYIRLYIPPSLAGHGCVAEILENFCQILESIAQTKHPPFRLGEEVDAAEYIKINGLIN